MGETWITNETFTRVHGEDGELQACKLAKKPFLKFFSYKKTFCFEYNISICSKIWSNIINISTLKNDEIIYDWEKKLKLQVSSNSYYTPKNNDHRFSNWATLDAYGLVKIGKW